MIVINSWILLKNVRGITLFPFIILRKKEYKNDLVLLNHERIHIEQQKEMLVVFFYFIYIFEFLYHYIKIKDSHIAYLMISFEKEAYQNEEDLNYLKNRKFWAFKDYFKGKK